MTKVFVDGSAGTTGLRICERLSERRDIELNTLSGERRKDPAAKYEAIAASDIAFLCLPDAAAVETVRLVQDLDTVIIDTSTAHRVDPEWVYGFPEIGDLREQIACARRIANPGCHASGVVALIAPLAAAGVLDPGALISVTSLTGYSGGGKAMIAEYEDAERDALMSAPRAYALTQTHKHLAEMRALTGLYHEPAFFPIVADFYSGMETLIALFPEMLYGGIEDIRKIYAETYRGPVVTFDPSPAPAFLSAATLMGRDDMVVSVAGNDERIVLTALFDNLGKGASGAAIQNMNIVMGVDSTTGLNLPGRP